MSSRDSNIHIRQNKLFKKGHKDKEGHYIINNQYKKRILQSLSYMHPK